MYWYRHYYIHTHSSGFCWTWFHTCTVHFELSVHQHVSAMEAARFSMENCDYPPRYKHGYNINPHKYTHNIELFFMYYLYNYLPSITLIFSFCLPTRICTQQWSAAVTRSSGPFKFYATPPGTSAQNPGNFSSRKGGIAARFFSHQGKLADSEPRRAPVIEDLSLAFQLTVRLGNGLQGTETWSIILHIYIYILPPEIVNVEHLSKI